MDIYVPDLWRDVLFNISQSHGITYHYVSSYMDTPNVVKVGDIMCGGCSLAGTGCPHVRVIRYDIKNTMVIYNCPDVSQKMSFGGL